MAYQGFVVYYAHSILRTSLKIQKNQLVVIRSWNSFSAAGAIEKEEAKKQFEMFVRVIS